MAWASGFFGAGLKKGGEQVLKAYGSKAGQATGVYMAADTVAAWCRDGKSPTAEMVTSIKQQVKTVASLKTDYSQMSDVDFLMRFGSS